jgi:hypothetical protein
MALNSYKSKFQYPIMITKKLIQYLDLWCLYTEMTPILSYIIFSFTYVHSKIFLRIYIYVYIYMNVCMYLYLHIYIGLKRLTVDVKSVFKTIQTSGFWMRSVESDFWTERKIALVLHFFGLTTDVYIYFYISYLHICINIYMCVFVPISTIICLNACISLNLCIYI